MRPGFKLGGLANATWSSLPVNSPAFSLHTQDGPPGDYGSNYTFSPTKTGNVSEFERANEPEVETVVDNEKPAQETALPTNREERKGLPVWSGIMGPGYFPDAFETLVRRRTDGRSCFENIDLDQCFIGLSSTRAARRESLAQLAIWAIDTLQVELAPMDPAVGCLLFVDRYRRALIELARCSMAGNKQHCNGEALVWAREKSSDHEDCALRHFLERGTVDTDGIRHTAKVLWRTLAMLQLEIEKGQAEPKQPKEPPTVTIASQARADENQDPKIITFIDTYGVKTEVRAVSTDRYEWRYLWNYWFPCDLSEIKDHHHEHADQIRKLCENWRPSKNQEPKVYTFTDSLGDLTEARALSGKQYEWRARERGEWGDWWDAYIDELDNTGDIHHGHADQIRQLCENWEASK